MRSGSIFAVGRFGFAAGVSSARLNRCHHWNLRCLHLAGHPHVACTYGVRRWGFVADAPDLLELNVVMKIQKVITQPKPAMALDHVRNEGLKAPAKSMPNSNDPLSNQPPMPDHCHWGR